MLLASLNNRIFDLENKKPVTFLLVSQRPKAQNRVTGLPTPSAIPPKTSRKKNMGSSPHINKLDF